MARPRYCGIEGCESEADVLVSFLETGDTLDMCNAHFAEFCANSAAALGMVWPERGTDAGDVASPAGTPEAETAETTAGDAGEAGPAGSELPAGSRKGRAGTRRAEPTE